MCVWCLFCAVVRVLSMSVNEQNTSLQHIVLNSDVVYVEINSLLPRI